MSETDFGKKVYISAWLISKRRMVRIEKRRREMDNLEKGAEPPPPICDEEEIEKIEDEHLKLKMDSGDSMCRNKKNKKRIGWTGKKVRSQIRT